ncbi:MAG: hypothetical protein WD872_21610 [Pirellulaceae bacterium]
MSTRVFSASNSPPGDNLHQQPLPGPDGGTMQLESWKYFQQQS